MSTKRTALLVMARMALADGNVGQQERELILPLLDSPDQLEGLLEEAQAAPLPQLLAQVDRYADRFFIAMRAASMAHIDGQFSGGEQFFYADLLDQLQLRPEDVTLIQTSIRQLDELEPVEPDARIGELFQQSSFC